MKIYTFPYDCFVIFLIYVKCIYSGHSLLQFLRRCAEHYLNSEQQEVRIESVRTCSRLLRLAIESPQSKTSHTVRYTISTVIKQLLVVGVSDIGW